MKAEIVDDEGFGQRILRPFDEGEPPKDIDGRRVIAPQPGFQTRFLSSRADITIGGGAAGCGKTFGELQAAARHSGVGGFSATIFRQTMPQVRNSGGLWDESWKLYPHLGARPNVSRHSWLWPSTARVTMSHLDGMEAAQEWMGAQVPLIIFDELTHFLEEVFWFMLSRNRSTCGVRPYVMASCNPDADSWVAKLIEWWIDQDATSPTYGLPIPSRAGRLRYFTRVNDRLVWGSSRREVIEAAGIPVAPAMVKSLTFIPGKLEENPILEAADPGYRANLMVQNRVTRARLLDGNWKIRANAGDYFKASEVTMLDERPIDVVEWVRRWDLAATEPTETNKDPDWTCGVLMGRRRNGRYVVADVIFARRRADEVRQLVLRTAANDGRLAKVGIPQDPGQAGKDQAASYVRELAGFTVFAERETGPKTTRAEPLSSQWQRNNVDVVRGAWNAEYFDQMEGFPQAAVHDDAVDASAGAFNRIAAKRSMLDPAVVGR